MSFLSLLRKKEPLLSLDIGTSGIKLIELDLSPAKPRLVNIAMAPLAADVFSNNAISKTDVVAQQLSSILEANSITPKRVAIALPGPSVFTKVIKTQQMDISEVASYIQLEAGSFILMTLKRYGLIITSLAITMKKIKWIFSW